MCTGWGAQLAWVSRGEPCCSCCQQSAAMWTSCSSTVYRCSRATSCSTSHTLSTLSTVPQLRSAPTASTRVQAWLVCVGVDGAACMHAVCELQTLSYEQIETVLAACSYSDPLAICCTCFFSDLHFVCSASSTAGHVLARLPKHLQCKSTPAALRAGASILKMLATVYMLPIVCRSTRRGSRLKTTQQW